MADSIGSTRTLKRKNVKGLALAAPAPRAVATSESDLQIPGNNVGDEITRQTAQLEIGLEYKLDLKKEDLEVLKELGHGNGGTVSKVRHLATGTIMARKVSTPRCCNHTCVNVSSPRSFTSRQRKKCAVESFASFRLCTIAIPSIL